MKDIRDICFFFSSHRISGNLFFFTLFPIYKKEYVASRKNNSFLFFFCPGNDTSFDVEHCSCEDGSPTYIAKLSVLNWPVHLLSFSVNVLA